MKRPLGGPDYFGPTHFYDPRRQALAMTHHPVSSMHVAAQAFREGKCPLAAISEPWGLPSTIDSLDHARADEELLVRAVTELNQLYHCSRARKLPDDRLRVVLGPEQEAARHALLMDVHALAAQCMAFAFLDFFERHPQAEAFAYDMATDKKSPNGFTTQILAIAEADPQRRPGPADSHWVAPLTELITGSSMLVAQTGRVNWIRPTTQSIFSIMQDMRQNINEAAFARWEARALAAACSSSSSQRCAPRI